MLVIIILVVLIFFKINICQYQWRRWLICRIETIVKWKKLKEAFAVNCPRIFTRIIENFTQVQTTGDINENNKYTLNRVYNRNVHCYYYLLTNWIVIKVKVQKNVSLVYSGTEF